MAETTLVRTTNGDMPLNDSRLRVGGARTENTGAVTPTLSINDSVVDVTHASTTGVAAPVAPIPGQIIILTNSTGADFTTGDFLVPTGSTWLLALNAAGTWKTIQSV